jgi:ABC-type branched-subunit amino acid transport system substrate-binding protein
MMALIGKFSETPFTDLIQFYTSSRQTVAVTVSLTDGRGDDGVFYIEDGDVVDAWLGESVGRDAIRRALRLSGGSFRVEPNIRAAERTVTEPWRQLLLEELVNLDEESRRTPKPSSAPSTPPPLKHEPPAGATELDGAALMASASQAKAAHRPATTGSVKPATPAPAPAPMPESPGGAGKWIAIGVAGVLIVGAAGFFLTRQPSKSGGAATAQATPAAEGATDPNKTGSPSAATLPTLTFGMVSPLNGANKELGLGIKAGVEAAFAAANDAGGVQGHRLALVALDDGNEPTRTADGMRDLIENRHVFAVVGNAGTATASAALPMVAQKKVPLIGALSGAGLRKQPPDRYVFVYRPGLSEETAAAVRYLVEVRRVQPNEIAVFAQDDDFGEAGWKGAAEQLKAYGQAPDRVMRTRYRRNSADVEEAVKRLKASKEVKAVVMVATDAPAARLVEKVLAASPNILFTDVSSVDVSALSEELVSSKIPLRDNVVVTQVVPLPSSRSTAVMRYRDAIEKYALGEVPGALSLEGWVVGTLVIEALKVAGPNPDQERLVNALEGLRIDIGIGVPLGFSPTDHQASHKVWGTALEAAGTWKQIDLQ